MMTPTTLTSYRKVTTRPCGCVTTESGGHTHIKMCAACRAEYFAKFERREKPSNLDLVGG